MSATFCVVFEQDVAPYGKLGGDNVALAKHNEKLDTVAAKNGLSTLGSLLSQSPEDMADLLDVDADTMDLPAEEWFEARDGLAAVQGLIAFLRSNPNAVSKSTELLSELVEVEAELGAAVSGNVRFHFAIVP